MTTEHSGEEPAGAGFAVSAEGSRWAYAGALTYDNAGEALAAAAALPLPAAGEVDLRAIGPVDSTVIAVLLALKRRAAAEGRAVTFANVPPAVRALADLYDVAELLAS